MTKKPIGKSVNFKCPLHCAPKIDAPYSLPIIAEANYSIMPVTIEADDNVIIIIIIINQL